MLEQNQIKPVRTIAQLEVLRAQWKKARRSLSPAKTARDQLKQSLDALMDGEDGDRVSIGKRANEIVESLLDARERYKKVRQDYEIIGGEIRSCITEVESLCTDMKRELESA